MQNDNSRRCRVLLVEDNRTHREFVSRILEKIGCDVTIAYDGKDALHMVREEPFDIVLMDIEMPKMNGIEAARQMRDMRRHHDIEPIPIIAISSDPQPDVREECLDAGMVDFIPKSIWRPEWEPSIRAKLKPWLRAGQHNSVA